MEEQDLYSIKRFSAENMREPIEIHNVIASSLEEAVKKIRKYNRILDMEKDQIRNEEAEVTKMDQVEQVETVKETETTTKTSSNESESANERRDEVEAPKE